MRATAITAYLPQLNLAEARAALRSRPAPLLLLGAAIVVDFFFVGLHITQSATGALSEDAYIYQDGGYAEWFQYLKYVLVLAMTLILLARSGNAAYITLATMAAFLLFDDALMFHENVGDEIGAALPFDSLGGLRAEDFGELAVYAAVGFVFLAAAVAGYLRQGAESKRFLLGFFAIMVALAFFAVGIDMVHQTLLGIPGLGLIEDSGEMFVTSVLIAFVFYELTAETRPRAPSGDSVS